MDLLNNDSARTGREPITRMKRLTSFLLAVLLILTMCSVYALAADGESEKDYLALGDSISAGYGLSSPETEGYTYLVAEGLGYKLVNRAVDGYTAEDVYDLIKDGALDTLITEAELITLTCGGNDLMALLYTALADAYNAENDPDITPEEVLSVIAGTHASLSMTALLPYASTVLSGFTQTDSFQAGLENYKEDLTAVMRYLRGKNPTARIVLCTQYNPYDAFEGHMVYGSLYTEVEAGVARLNQVITDNADTLGYTVADVYTAFKDTSANLCVANIDNMLEPNLDFHPNAEGHFLISETVLSVVQSEEETTEETTETSTDGVSEPAATTEAVEPEGSLSETESTSPIDGTTELVETAPSPEASSEIESPDCIGDPVTDPESSSEDTSGEASADESETETRDGSSLPDTTPTEDGGCGATVRLPAALLVLLSVAFAIILLRRGEEKPL